MKQDIEKLENDINYNKRQMKEKGSYIPFDIKLTERVEKLLKAHKEKSTEHKIMKRILVENGLWEKLLNDGEFINYLKEE